MSGGGAFLIPYFIALFLCGLPVMLLELAAGRFFRSSIITTFAMLGAKLKLLGIFPLITSFLILSYYSVIAGWTLSYFVFSMACQQYPEFTHFTESPLPLLFFGITLVAGWAIVRLGIKGGIERVCSLLMPLLFLALGVLLVRALTLPDAEAGLRFLFEPDLSALREPQVWLLAFGQAFFSLSVGFGILLTYGSYLEPGQRLPVSALIIGGSDTLIALLAGVVIFPTVFAFGLSPAAGPELAFLTLPRIFEKMSFGMFFGALFFGMLFVGALTSSISMLELVVSNLKDTWEVPRRRATLLVTLATLAIGLPSALSYAGVSLKIAGLPFLDAMDYLAGGLMLPLAAAVICGIIAWKWRAPEILAEINRNARMIRVLPIFIYLARYVIPVMLLGLFLWELFALIGLF